MSYAEQLAYLRQKREQTANSVTQAPSTVAREQAQSPEGQSWQEVDEEALRAIEERQKKDEWLMEAGEGVNTATSVDVSRLGKDEEELFKKEFDSTPLMQKYGTRVDQLLQELYAQVQDPNSPLQGEQALKVFGDMLNRMFDGEFDDGE